MKNYNNPVKKSRVRLTNSMTMLNPNTAGVDIGSEFHWVCVNPSFAKDNIQKFGAYTCELKRMASWLKDCGITSIAMESTGVYWIPLYQILENYGFEVILVNARHLKSVAGRPKTDIYDCQWIQRLHSYGLLQASFRPADEICKLRTLKRHRDNLVQGTSQHIQHMQKALQLSNIRLDKAVSDITGKTGMLIMRSILKGERDPHKLAKNRDWRLKASESEVAAALEGDYRVEHIFMLKQSFNAYEFVQSQIAECDREIKVLLSQIEKKLDINIKPIPPASTREVKRNNLNQPSPKLRPYLYETFGVDLTQVPGFQMATILTLLTEIGTDLSKWQNDKYFKSWLGLCVNKEISGGKVLRNRTRKVKNRAAGALRMAATTLKNSDTYLGAFYRRIRARAGAPKAVTATAAKLAVIFYNMVKYQREYKALDVKYYDKNYEKRVFKSIKAKANLLGYKLVPVDNVVV